MIDPHWIKCTDTKDFYKLSDEFKQSRRRKIRPADIVLNYGLEYIIYSYFLRCYYITTLHRVTNLDTLFNLVKEGAIFFTEDQYKQVKDNGLRSTDKRQ